MSRRSSTDSNVDPVSSLIALAVWAEMTTSPSISGAIPPNWPSSIGKESTSVVWAIWRYCWLSLAISLSSTIRTLNSDSVYPKAFKVRFAAFFIGAGLIFILLWFTTWIRGIRLRLSVRYRVFNPLVMYGCQDLVEVLGYLVEVLESEFAFVKLAVTEYAVYQPVHQTLNPGGSRLCQRAAGRLDYVGQHYKSGFFGLGFGAGIAEVVRVDRRKE